MPLYQYVDTRTGVQWEDLRSYEDHKIYLSENPDIHYVITALNIVSGVAGITHKVDGGFKDLMGRIGNANPHSPLGHEYGSKGIKETKIREVVQKHKRIQSKSD